jgi:hypothetical protein
VILSVAPPGAPDLEQAFIDGSMTLFRELQRGDEEVAHVSDMSGMCDRLVHARRSGKTLMAPDHASVTNMSLGLALEEYLMPRIEAGLVHQGFKLERNLVVVLSREPDGEVRGQNFTKEHFELWKPDNWNPERMIKGHIDGLVYKDDFIAIIDTKTKPWKQKFVNAAWEFYPGKEYRDSHLVQIGSYGLGFDRARYGAIFEFNKAGCESRTGWFELESVYPVVKQRFYEVLARTNPDNPEPDIGPLPWTEVRPGESWACGYYAPVYKGPNRGKQVVKKAYCEYTACPLHIASRTKALKELSGEETLGGLLVE